MANLEEMEAELSTQPTAEEELAEQRKKFLDTFGYQYNRADMTLALDAMIAHIKNNR